MRTILMAATAFALAGTAMAQTTNTGAPPPTGATMGTNQPVGTAGGQSGTPGSQTGTMGGAMGTTTSPSGTTMGTTGSMSGSTMGTPGAMSGSMNAGGTVRVTPSRPVSEAFPPPPPRESYPVCSRTVTDNCRNPGNR